MINPRHKAIAAGLAATLTFGTVAVPMIAAPVPAHADEGDDADSSATDTAAVDVADADEQVVDREDVYEAVAEQPSLVASFLSLFSSRAASLSPMSLSAEMKYFAQNESGSRYYLGFSAGDGYNALGFYQFDRRYALVPFMEQVYAYNSGKYSMLKPVIDRKAEVMSAGSSMYDSKAGKLTELGQLVQDAWTAAYDADPTEFSRLQDGYGYANYYLPVEQKLASKYGIDLSGRYDCVKGLAWGMTNLFGSGGVEKFLSAAKLSESMTDEEMVRALCRAVVDYYSTGAGSSNQYATGYVNRYKREQNTCLEYIAAHRAEEEAAKPSTPSVPSGPGAEGGTGSGAGSTENGGSGSAGSGGASGGTESGSGSGAGSGSGSTEDGGSGDVNGDGSGAGSGENAGGGSTSGGSGSDDNDGSGSAGNGGSEAGSGSGSTGDGGSGSTGLGDSNGAGDGATDESGSGDSGSNSGTGDGSTGGVGNGSNSGSSAANGAGGQEGAGTGNGSGNEGETGAGGESSSGSEAEDDQAPVSFTVTYKVRGDVLKTVAVVKDGKVVEPSEEPFVSGYSFAGWYLDGEPFDFSTPVTGDMELVAYFQKNADSGKADAGEKPSALPKTGDVGSMIALGSAGIAAAGASLGALGVVRRKNAATAASQPSENAGNGDE